MLRLRRRALARPHGCGAGRDRPLLAGHPGGEHDLALGPDRSRRVERERWRPWSELEELERISEKGFGKLTDLNRYRRQGRGGSGIKTLDITKRTGAVAAAEVIADSDQVYLVSKNAQVLRTSLSEIRSSGRATQGVTIFRMEPGDSVASIACANDIEVPENAVAVPSADGKGNGRAPAPRLKGA